MGIRDQAGEQPVGGQQFPNHVRMARQHLWASIAQVRRQRRAGSDGVAQLRRCRRGVADRHPDAVRDQMLDQRHGARHFRGERDQHDAPEGSVLTPFEVVDAGRRDELAWMRAADAVGRRQVRPFHVDAGGSRVCDAGDDSRVRRKPIE